MFTAREDCFFEFERSFRHHRRIDESVFVYILHVTGVLDLLDNAVQRYTQGYTIMLSRCQSSLPHLWVQSRRFPRYFHI
jgi:hypothetical protein